VTGRDSVPVAKSFCVSRAAPVSRATPVSVGAPISVGAPVSVAAPVAVDAHKPTRNHRGPGPVVASFVEPAIPETSIFGRSRVGTGCREGG